MTDLPEIERRGRALVYPIPPDARLDTHERFDLYVRRLLRSDTVRDAVRCGRMEELGAAMLLWFHSFEESPLGTIPDDEEGQAFLLHMPLARWRRISRGTLASFRPVVAEDGTPMQRLANPTMLAVCLLGWVRRCEHEAEKARRTLNQRRKRLRDAAAEAGLSDGARAAMKSGEVADLYLGWIEAQGLAINAMAVTDAHAAIMAGWQPGAVVPLPGRARGQAALS